MYTFMKNCIFFKPSYLRARTYRCSFPNVNSAFHANPNIWGVMHLITKPLFGRFIYNFDFHSNLIHVIDVIKPFQRNVVQNTGVWLFFATNSHHKRMQMQQCWSFRSCCHTKMAVTDYFRCAHKLSERNPTECKNIKRAINPIFFIENRIALLMHNCNIFECPANEGEKRPYFQAMNGKKNSNRISCSGWIKNSGLKLKSLNWNAWPCH